MRAGMLALTGCVIILYSSGILPARYWLVGAGVMLLGAAPYCVPGRGVVTAAAAAMLVSGAWVVPQLQSAQPTITPAAEEDGVLAYGYPCSLPGHTADGAIRILLCVQGWAEPGASLPVPARVQLRIPQEPDRFRWQGPLQAELSLRAPVGIRNHGDDGGYERWLYRHGIDATARVSSIEADPDSECPLVCRYHRFRQQLLERIETRLQRMREPALAEALMLGSRERLTDQHWEVLEATGTNHLVAISGLHVGLIALIVGWPLRRAAVVVAGVRPGLAQWLPLFVIWVACLGYALLAGFTIPTQRALAMVMVASYVLTSGRQWRLWDGWLLALVLVLLLDPLAPLDMGFWLSFAAVACLLLVFGGRLRQPGALRALVMAQVAVMAGLWPALQAFGRDATMTALPANLFAIPALSVFLMPVLLVAGPLVLLSERTAAWVEPGLDLAFGLFWQVLVTLSLSDWRLPSLPLPALLGITVVIFLFFMPTTRRWRVAASLVLAAVVGLGAQPQNDAAPPQTAPEVYFPDGVGGSVAVARSAGETLLFDARSPAPARRGQTRDRLIPWLAERGIDHIDALVLSHPGTDPQRRWRFADQTPTIGRILQGRGCQSGETLAAGQWRATLWRDPRQSGLIRAEQACNLVLESSNTRAVLFGPIRRSGERRLLRWLDDPASVDWVMAPRRGVEGSSQQGMIEALAPRKAVLAATDPLAPVAALYREQGAGVANVARDGEVRISLGDDGHLQVKTAREQVPFWIRDPDWMTGSGP